MISNEIRKKSLLDFVGRWFKNSWSTIIKFGIYWSIGFSGRTRKLLSMYVPQKGPTIIDLILRCPGCRMFWEVKDKK